MRSSFLICLQKNFSNNNALTPLHFLYFKQFSWGYISKLSMTNKALHYSVRTSWIFSFLNIIFLLLLNLVRFFTSHYKVDFDGGYTLDNLPANKIYTEAEYRESFGILPQLPPNQNEKLSTVSRKSPLSSQNSELSAAISVDAFPNSSESSRECNANHLTRAAKISSNMTLEDLYRQRCEQCTLCKRRDCGHCFTCLSNIKKKDLDSKEVCLRKVIVRVFTCR
jgi:hypothetical protein